MEKLAALCCLWGCELGKKEDYDSELNRLFLENPEDDFLLELETIPSASDENSDVWYKSYKALEKQITDRSLFERELFIALGDFYDKYCITDAEYDEISARFGSDYKAREEYFETSGKITLKVFSERCFELGDTVSIDNVLMDVLRIPHFTYRNLDRFAGEFPLSDEEYFEEIRQTFRKTFDYFKETK